MKRKPILPYAMSTTQIALNMGLTREEVIELLHSALEKLRNRTGECLPLHALVQEKRRVRDDRSGFWASSSKARSRSRIRTVSSGTDQAWQSLPGRQIGATATGLRRTATRTLKSMEARHGMEL